MNGHGSGEMKSRWPVDPRFRKLPRGTSITTSTSGASGQVSRARWRQVTLAMARAYPMPPDSGQLKGRALAEELGLIGEVLLTMQAFYANISPGNSAVDTGKKCGSLPGASTGIVTDDTAQARAGYCATQGEFGQPRLVRKARLYLVAGRAQKQQRTAGEASAVTVASVHSAPARMPAARVDSSESGSRHCPAPHIPGSPS